MKLSDIFVLVFVTACGISLLMQAMIQDNITYKRHDHSAVPYMRLEQAEKLVAYTIHRDESCWYEAVHYVMYRADNEIRVQCKDRLPILGEE